MKSVNTILILITAFLAVFLQALFAGMRDWIGTQINVLPPLIVVSAFYGGGRAVALLSIFGGLWFDSLSANPLGVSILPLFVVGQILHHQRELILRDSMYAQFVLGAGASLAVPLLTLLLLFSMGLSPITGWGTLWQLLVMAVTGGALTPLSLRFFRFIRRSFFHQPPSQPSFREDREIRRGRI